MIKNYSFTSESFIKRKMSRMNEDEKDPETERIKQNPLLEREQLRKSIMIAKQKSMTEENSFFSGSKLSAEIFRHLKESSNQSYLNVLKKEEKSRDKSISEDSHQKFSSMPSNSYFNKGQGTTNKKSASNQAMSNLKKEFIKDLAEKTQNTFEKTQDPNTIIFNQLAPSALASYRWRSTSIRNRIVKLRSQSPTVRYKDEFEDVTFIPPPMLSKIFFHFQPN
jgi:hypothetical protein